MRLMRCAKARAGVDVRVLVPNGSPERRLTSRARCSGKGQCMSKVPPAQCAIAIWRAAAQARRALDNPPSSPRTAERNQSGWATFGEPARSTCVGSRKGEKDAKPKADQDIDT